MSTAMDSKPASGSFECELAKQQQQLSQNDTGACLKHNGDTNRPLSPADSHLDELADQSLTDSSHGHLSSDFLEVQLDLATNKLDESKPHLGNTNQPDDEGHESMSSASGETASDKLPDEAEIPCSAVHALERDMPDFDYQHLVDQLRLLILQNIDQNPGLYSQKEVLKCRQDDWFLTRFLLRHQMDVGEAFEMLKRTMRYHNESLCCLLKPEDFPAEFYQLGGTFSYMPDRKGNQVMYMRVKVHRKTPEIKAVVESFLYYNLLKTDELAKGRGIALVMDCTGGGLQNADIELLYFLVSNLKNYFPRGLSYMLVHNLPWILKPFWHLAKNWVPEEHRQLIKFSNDRTIFEFVARENLPDFLGGTCEKSYRQAPENCTNLQQAIKFWGIEMKVARSILAKFRDNLPPEAVSQLQKSLDDMEDLMIQEKNRKEMEKTPEILKDRSNNQ